MSVNPRRLKQTYLVRCQARPEWEELKAESEGPTGPKRAESRS